MKTQSIQLIAVVVLLSGCVANENPKEGGLFGGIHGLSSGSYERRVQEREDNLAKMRALQQELNQETTSLDAQKQQRQMILDEERRQLATLNTDVKALEIKLASMQKEKGSSDKRLTDIQTRLTNLKSGLSTQQNSLDALEGNGVGGADSLEGTGTGMPTDSRRQQLEAQRLELQQEYDDLLNLTLMLAK